MDAFQKFRAICIAYNAYYDMVKRGNLEFFLVQKVMLKAHKKEKNISLEEFVTECVKDPINYLYEKSRTITDSEMINLKYVTNCFNDKNDTHYGCKYKDKWFFLSHSANQYSLKLLPTDYKLRDKYSDTKTHLVSYSGMMPNIKFETAGVIRRDVLEEYITKFL